MVARQENQARYTCSVWRSALVAVPERPKAVIFDMDGLLFDSEVLSREALLAAARELGHVFTVEDFPQLVGRPWAANQVTLQNHIGPSGDVQLFHSTWTRHYNERRETLALKPGVTDFLDWLDEVRLPRAICTSSSHADVAYNINAHGLVGRFDAVIAAGDYDQGKPSPDPFLRAAAALGIAPDACLALEDSHNGVRAAAAAGMRTIMVPDLLPPTEDLRPLCEFVAVDLHEVLLYLMP